MNPVKNNPPRWSLRFLNLFVEKGPVHGLPYVGKKQLTVFERILWLLLAFVAVYISLHLALESLERFRTKSTVISIEKDFHYWNSTMPSATICPMARLSKEKFEDYCSLKNISGTEQVELFEFLESLANSSFFNFNDIKEYPSIDKHNINPKDYIYLIYNLTDDYLRKPYLPLLAQSNAPIDSQQILTEWGICYSTNSLIIDHLSTSQLLFGKSAKPIQWNGTVPNIVHHIWSVNVFEENAVYQFLGIPGWIEVFVHGASEVMKVEKRRGPHLLPLSCTVQVFEITASDDFARSTTLEQRQCRFHYESNLTHFPIYTRNLCQQECRINLAYKLCKCIPHFYPNPDGKKPVCHYKVLKDCLFKYAEVFESLNKIKTLSLDMDAINCYCLPNCISSEIVEETCEFMADSNSVVHDNGIFFDMKQCPRIRLQRQILFTVTDLLVSIGGTAGFFLGSSLLNIVEILYYFTFRLIMHCFGYKE